MYGYDTDAQREAQDWIDDQSDATEVPPAWVVRAFERNDGFPYTGTHFRVIDAAWTEGQPRHGEMRSDDHTSHWEVQAPLRNINVDPHDDEDDDDVGGHCPECDATEGIYRYHAYHHIAGHITVLCARCEEELWGTEWG